MPARAGQPSYKLERNALSGDIGCPEMKSNSVRVYASISYGRAIPGTLKEVWRLICSGRAVDVNLTCKRGISSPSRNVLKTEGALEP